MPAPRRCHNCGTPGERIAYVWLIVGGGMPTDRCAPCTLGMLHTWVDVSWIGIL